MAAIRHRLTGRSFELKADTLVGRSSRCDLALSHESVSQTHASIRFLGGTWHVEDRNSKNGTWVNGEYLSRTGSHRLEAGTTLRFGAKGVEEWVLLDTSPPTLSMAGLTTARMERLIVQASLRVYADLSLEVTTGTITQTLKGRVPYLVVQALGRERLADRELGRAADEEGWLDRRLLAERLRNRDVNQDIHRIRQDFARLELFEDAESIVEDQREQGKVRLGIYRLRVD
jgi:pSer/pThr/pTyr-binding forkhead associated (FHA) protein